MKSFSIFVESIANVIGAGAVAGAVDIDPDSISAQGDVNDDTQDDILRHMGRVRPIVAGLICLKINSSDDIDSNSEYIQMSKKCAKIIVCYKDTHQYFVRDVASGTMERFYPMAQDFNEYQG